jgi:flagellar FliJ protein
MVRSKRLQPVADIAQKKERSAAEKLGESKRVLAEQEHKLSELQSYRLEYQQRLNDMGRQGISGSVLMGYQRFLAQLDQVIRQQSDIVQRAAGAVNQSQDHWQQAYTEQSAIQSVIKKHQQTEYLAQQQREQKETDELVNNKVASRAQRQEEEWD